MALDAAGFENRFNIPAKDYWAANWPWEGRYLFGRHFGSRREAPGQPNQGNQSVAEVLHGLNYPKLSSVPVQARPVWFRR